MLAVLLIIIAAASTLYLYSEIRGLRRNIAAAKSSGFPYVVVPIFLSSLPPELAQPFILPLVDRLPESWTQRWLPLLRLNVGWHYGYKPFKTARADTLIVVSSSHNVLHTCDPEVSTQFFRSSAFGKPAELLGILNIFGPTMTGTEGPETRLYRRITAPFFNEQTLNQVWQKSISNTGTLLKVLLRDDAPGYNKELRPTLARLTLHLLNAVCYERDEDCLDELLFTEQVPPGHELSYSQAMHGVLDSFITIYATPRIILDNSPLQEHRKARQAYAELRKYMEELRDRKRSGIESGNLQKEPSLLDIIIQAGEPSSKNPSPLLHPSAVMGQIFIFMFAGHEANANTLTFIILLLACNPDAQKLLQKDLDRILTSRPAHSWSYARDYPLLSQSYVAAVVNEALRLYTVLPYIPKTVSAPTPITANGTTHVIPPDTLILINTSAVHHHPKLWPRSSGSFGGDTPHPVTDFHPQHWLTREGETSFLRPRPGAFMPFSDGARGCLGRAFALVELCAIVSRLFAQHSVELVVEGVAPDASEREKQAAWEAAREQAAHDMSRGVEFHMSLRMTKVVRVRFVERGEGKER